MPVWMDRLLTRFRNLCVVRHPYRRRSSASATIYSFHTSAGPHRSGGGGGALSSSAHLASHTAPPALNRQRPRQQSQLSDGPVESLSNSHSLPDSCNAGTAAGCDVLSVPSSNESGSSSSWASKIRKSSSATVGSSGGGGGATATAATTTAKSAAATTAATTTAAAATAAATTTAAHPTAAATTAAAHPTAAQPQRRRTKSSSERVRINDSSKLVPQSLLVGANTDVAALLRMLDPDADQPGRRRQDVGTTTTTTKPPAQARQKKRSRQPAYDQDVSVPASLPLSLGKVPAPEPAAARKPKATKAGGAEKAKLLRKPADQVLGMSDKASDSESGQPRAGHNGNDDGHRRRRMKKRDSRQSLEKQQQQQQEESTGASALTRSISFNVDRSEATARQKPRRPAGKKAAATETAGGTLGSVRVQLDSAVATASDSGTAASGASASADSAGQLSLENRQRRRQRMRQRRLGRQRRGRITGETATSSSTVTPEAPRFSKVVEWSESTGSVN